MDRSREGRRAGAAGGPAYAPRRPRTGFKEASAGDDADDMMDDGHNPRLRERLKKESSGLVLGQSAVSISRNKRKRQGSQEMQVQARNSPADDLEEVTEDTEMGVSEDDDDPPPPIISRRPGKPRPQGKIPEDSISVDLPAVPRKARTAILKRPQESVLPPSADPPSLQPSTVIPSAPAPSSTPSSSSIASLKPGRRTKPSGTKPRGSKLPKVSTPVMVSEQEVEVAEALFDLARMFTQPTSSSMELEEKSSLFDSKSETKVDPKAFESAAATTLMIQPSNGPFNTISTSLSAPAPSSALAGPVTAFSPAHASAVSPIHHPSPPPPGAAPAAEAPKRKRPRVRTRPEAGTSNQSRAAASPATDLSSATGTSGSQSKEADYILIRPSITDKCAIKEEANTATAVIAAISSVANTTVTFSMPLPASATTAVIPVLPSTVATGSVPRPGVSLEKRSSNTEKKNVINITKADVSNSSLVENKSIVQLAVEKGPKAANLPGPALLGSEEEASCCTTAPAELLTTKLEYVKRSPQPADAVNGDQTIRPQIDLMVSPIKLPAASNNDRNVDDPEAAAQNLPEKANVEMAIAFTGETLWLDEKMEREEKELQDTDKEKDREWERDFEQHDRGRERGEQNEVDTRKELSKDLPIERETEKERERYDSSKLPGQRSSKILKADVGRSQKAVSATSSSGNPGTTSSATGVASNVAALPLSMGLLSWPGGLPGGLSYFPAAAAVSAVAEENPPSVQLPPYIMPTRQAWKRCALHVYIARFIDMQQQLSSHHTFFPSTNHLYGAKPYNLNMPLSPAESLLGSAVGVLPVGSIAGPSATSSSTAVVNLEAGEHGLNAAAIAAASSIHGVKERSYNLDMMNRKLPAQQQQSVQQQSTVPGHVGPMLGFPGTHTGTASVTGAVPTSATCVSNANMPSGAAVAVANTSSGSSSPMVGGPSSVGGLPSAVTNGSTVTAAVQAQYMHAMMQQSQKFSFAQYPPPPFCPTTFNGPPPNIGAQQAAAQFFAGGPFFTAHMVPHSQQQPGQQIVNSVSGGSSPIVKQQQGNRSLAPASSPQQQGARPQSPSHSQHQLSSHLQRPLDKDGPIVGDNGSTVDSKFPILHRSLYGQAPQNAAVANANPPTTAVLSGAVQSISSHSPDYNMVGLLGKPPKQRDQQSHQSSGQQQQQLQSQQPVLPSQLQQQHHSPGAALQMSVKGHESQTTQSSSMSMAGAMSRGSAVGPGPIGLAPVAAVMAPQGHAMLQSMGESGSFHPSQTPHPQLGAGSTHSNLLQQQHHQQLQQQHLIQMHQAQQHQTHPLQQQQLQQHQNQQSIQSQNQQRALQVGRAASSGPEDSRTILDVNLSTISNRGRERERERETPDDRKMSAKRSIATTPPLSREMEGCTSMQSSLGGAGCMTSSRNVGTTLNLMAPTHPNMSSRSSVPLIQQQVVQTTKQTAARSKGTNSPSPAGTNQSALSSFSDCVSLAGASLPGKVSSPGLLLSGQQNATTSSQVSRQAQVSQTAQMKLNQRTSLGQLAAPTAPTAPGTSLQVVLAAAMAKSPQLQQQQQRAQQATNSCSSSRLSATHPSPPPSSPGPLPPLPPVLKSAGLNPPKTGSSQKGSFPVSQKSAVTVGKRSSSPSSLPHVSSVLGPSPLAQNMSTQSLLAKNAQQQQTHNQQPTPQQQVQAQPQNSLQGQQQQRYQHSQQQGHHHKQSLPLQQQQQQQQNQQHTQQIMRQHLLQQQQQLHMFQQHQSPASQSPQAALSQQQPSQQLVSHQQQPPAPQLQQHSTHQQHQLQHLQQQQQQQQPQSPFPGSPANGGLTLGSSLSLGAGNNSGAASSIRNNNPESGGVSQNRPAYPSKQLVNAGIPLSSNSGTQRSNSTGPAFLQQFGSSASPSGQQQSGSPRNSNPSPYMQAGVNSAGGARSTDAKALPDGAELLNGVRTMQGSSPGRSPSTVSSSPTLQSPSQRTHTGGLPSSKPATGHFTGNNHGDTIQPRSGVVLSPSNNSATLSNSSPNGQQSSNTNVHIGADSRTTFVSGAPVSLNQGSLNPCQMHPTSSLSMASAPVTPTGLSPLSTQQPSTSVVQP